MKQIHTLALILLLAGCASSDHQQPFTGHQDSAALLEREALHRTETLNQNIAVLERRQRRLNGELEKVRQGQIPENMPTNQEEINVRAFQEMSRQSASTVAEKEASLELETARIENSLELKLAEIESEVQALLASVERRRIIEVAKVKAMHRAEAAKARANVKIESATVGAPVLTSKKAYAPELLPPSPALTEQSEAVTAEKGQVATTDKPKVLTPDFKKGLKEKNEIIAVGSTKPQSRVIVQAPPVKEPPSFYDVYYEYRDERSWKTFNKLLRAYGVTDMSPHPNPDKGVYYTYVGRYKSRIYAEKRKAELKELLHIDSAKIKRQSVN